MLDKEMPAVIALPYVLVNPDHIKIINGSTDILLIAPHACIRDCKPKDDENTGPITEAVARQIGCSAIINIHYHKPEEPKYPHGLKNGNLNLNVAADAERVPGYLNAIRDVVGEPGRPGKTTVIWIHGADDKKAVEVASDAVYDFPADKIHAFIGYGEGDEPKKKAGGNRETADLATVERFRDALISNGMNAVRTDDNAKNYRGRSEARMNQWFRQHKYPLGQVESIQLEIRKGGFRDLHHNIEKTADILIEALSQEILVPNDQEETEADGHLVEVAFTHLRGIFAKQIHEAMLQAGRYLVRTFYGSYENAVKNRKIRNKSLHQLIQKLSEASGNAPKKTWIYDAVKLAVDDHYFRSKKFRLYGKIGHYHKVLLTRVPEISRKKRLVREIANAKGTYTVDKLRQRIKETAKTNRVFITPENVPADEILEQLKRKKLEELLDKLDYRIRTGRKELVQYIVNRKRVREIVKNKPDDKRKPRKVGFRDWTDPSCNVNIQNGCSNNCLYCYAKTQAYRRKQVELGSWADQRIRKHDVDRHRNLYRGLVGFPSTHDITKDNLKDYLNVLGKLLRAGNEVLIVSKPRIKCITAICQASLYFKDKILFRFTIGAMDDGILGFWEPEAPPYQERKDCLQYAYDHGFKTSVSMEPLLAMDKVHEMIEDLRPFVSEDIWIGTMNHLTEIKKDADEKLQTEIAKIEAGQTPEKLKALYETYKGDSQRIRWKTDAWKVIHGDSKDIPTDAGVSAASNPEEVNAVTSPETTIHQVNESIKIVNADFYSWCADSLEPDSVDLILTDPPYSKKFLYLWDELAEVAAMVLKTDGYLVTYSGQLYLIKVMNALAKHLTYCTTVCLPHTGRKRMVYARRVLNGWKPIFIFKKGTFEGFDKPIKNIITDDKPDKKYHKWGQGEKAFEQLMDDFSKPNDLVLDPFVGGGTTLAVADKLGRKCIGIEKDPKLISVIKERILTASTPPEAIS